MTTVWEMEGLLVLSISLATTKYTVNANFFLTYILSKVKILPWVMHWGPVASPPISVLLCEIGDIFQR